MDSQVSPILHIQRQSAFDGRIETGPLRTQRCFLQVFCGACAFVIASPQQTLGLEDFHAGITSAHHTFFAPEQCLVLKPGDAVALPLNFAASVIGLPWDEVGKCVVLPGLKQAKPKDVEPFSAYVTTAIFDPVLDLKHSKEATTHALSTYISGLRKLPASIRSNAGVQAWLKAMEERKDDEHLRGYCQHKI